MRYSTIQKGLMFGGLQCLIFACSTVPDEAPREFHTAKAALERADKADVDDTLPTTMERAEDEFKVALDTWKKSRDTDVKKPDREALMKQSKDKATEAQTLTEQAINLQDQIKAWDGHIETYAQMVQEKQDAMAQLKQLQDQQKEAALASQNQNQNQQQVAVSPNINLRGPVAYFGPGSTDVDSRYESNINSLARTLTADTNAKVVLSGFADPRGDKAKNDRLARERAEAVASILKEKGVNENQIEVQAWPAPSKKSKHGRSQAQLQLDRRVEAYITTTVADSPKGTQEDQPQAR